jgi:5-methylcytosine-specific restriction protein A
MAGNWQGSDRRQRLPQDWAQRREIVRARAADRCEAILNDETRCPDQGTDCDHIEPGDNHEFSNLQWLCTWHHRKKTSSEGNSKRVYRVSEKHPKERHPGLI